MLPCSPTCSPILLATVCLHAPGNCRSTFPERMDCMYQHTKSFESVKSDMEMKNTIPTSLHVASLGYEDEWCPAASARRRGEKSRIWIQCKISNSDFSIRKLSPQNESDLTPFVDSVRRLKNQGLHFALSTSSVCMCPSAFADASVRNFSPQFQSANPRLQIQAT
jgi:hypothetical protein